MTKAPVNKTATAESIVPKGACDSHIHFYGPFEHYPPPAEPKYAVPDARPEQLFALQDSVGVSRAVVVNAAATSPDNQRTIDALRQYPDRLRGIITVPESVLTDAQLNQWNVLGVRGLRYSYVGRHITKFDDRLIARISELGWHLQVQVENRQILDLATLVVGLPCNLVIDHMGRIPAALGVQSEPFQCLLNMVGSEGAWVKLSAPMRSSSETGPPYSDARVMAQLLMKENPDRMLWGSDWPNVNHQGVIPTYSELLKLICDWVPDESMRSKLLVDNPVGLYGFEQLD
ncbi:amidohydrolase [Pusillimonas sp. T7-7]|uniref:amidohydrolase family protein n=1 Tax=Pusillimonas sp. (strain T7-7) TaxID=1007105 RepID=UPI00130530FE|nr:amidohydrolase family protein [Pusillimonas sp. T7-7]